MKDWINNLNYDNIQLFIKWGTLISPGFVTFIFKNKTKPTDYKKHLIYVYLYLIFSTYIGENSTREIIFTGIILTVYLLIVGYSRATNTDEIEKNLSSFGLIKYKMIEWFFLIELYYTYLLIMVLLLASLIMPCGNLEKTMIIIIIIFCTLHFLKDLTNDFEVLSFKEGFQVMEKYYEGKNDRKKYAAEFIEKEFDLESMISFLVYVEDKDYFVRKSYIVNFIVILKRKYFTYKGNYYPQKEHYKNYGKISLRNLRMFFPFIYYVVKQIPFFIHNRKNYIRGYSTIGQQLVRRTVMLDGQYDKYRYRRKFFVEFIYTKYFFKALRNYLNLQKTPNDRNNESEFEKELELKFKILVSYYNGILKCPTTFEELFYAFQHESISGITEYGYKVQVSRYNQDYLAHGIHHHINEGFSKYIRSGTPRDFKFLS